MNDVMRSIAVRLAARPRFTRHASRVLCLTHRGEKLADRLIRKAPTEGVLTARYHGIRMELDLRDNVQRTVFYKGAYEPALVRFLLAELESTDTFVDVGAHIGVFALPAARKLRRGHVYAFEPGKDTAGILERSAQRNALRSLTVVGAALGETSGLGSLRASPEWDKGDLGVRSLHAAGPIVANVPIIRFDDWASDAGLSRLDVVKVDVEGHEFCVLKGMVESLTRHRPRLLVLEIVEGHLKRAGTAPQEVAGFLNCLGYEPVGPSIEEIAARRTGAFWPNAVVRLAQ